MGNIYPKTTRKFVSNLTAKEKSETLKEWKEVLDDLSKNPPILHDWIKNNVILKVDFKYDYGKVVSDDQWGHSLLSIFYLACNVRHIHEELVGEYLYKLRLATESRQIIALILKDKYERHQQALYQRALQNMQYLRPN